MTYTIKIEKFISQKLEISYPQVKLIVRKMYKNKILIKTTKSITIYNQWTNKNEPFLNHFYKINDLIDEWEKKLLKFFKSLAKGKAKYFLNNKIKKLIAYFIGAMKKVKNTKFLNYMNEYIEKVLGTKERINWEKILSKNKVKRKEDVEELLDLPFFDFTFQ